MEFEIDSRSKTVSEPVYEPFNVALETLTRGSYELISLPQKIQLIIQQGKKPSTLISSDWVREGVLYFPGENPKLIRNSPLLEPESAKEAIRVQSRMREFYPTNEQIEQALEYSVDFPSGNFKIPTNRFSSEDWTVFAFGGEDRAREYGEFLKEVGIEIVNVGSLDMDYVNEQNGIFSRQIFSHENYVDRSLPLNVIAVNSSSNPTSVLTSRIKLWYIEKMLGIKEAKEVA